MTVHLLKSTFSRGELSKKAYSRVDLELYAGGAALLKNFINVIHGGARRRPGTRFAGSVKFADKNVRFIPFVFNSTGQAYVLEFGDFYVRFWTAGGRLEVAETPVEVVTPYAHTDVAALQFAQTGDTLFLAHEDYHPRQLIRSSHTSWSIEAVPFVDGPYFPLNDTQETLTSDGNLDEGVTTTLTLSNVSAVNNGAGFQATDVGRFVRMRGASKWVHGVISVVTDTTHVDVTWLRVGAGTTAGDDVTTGGAGSATKSWRLGAFSATTGYPSSVSFFEGRLVWGRTNTLPRTSFYSRSGLPYDHAPSHGDSTVTADLGFTVNILGRDEILWMVERSRLQIGTASGIRTVGASDGQSALAPDNVSQRLEVNVGASSTLPVDAQDVTVYTDKFGRSLHNLYYSFEQNSLVGPSFSELSDHLLLAGVKELAFQQVPEPILWARDDNGSLFGVTYNRDQKVIGFHQHDIAGGIVKTFTTIPGATQDEIWLCIERTINGNTVRYVEVIDPVFEEQNAADAFFVDCGLTYSGAPANSVSGLGHLEGKEVAILADGAVMPRRTVVSGSISLANDVLASKIHVGLPQTAEIELLRPPHQQRDGVILGRKQRVVRAIVEVIRSGGLRVGIRDGETEDLRERHPSDLMDEPPPLADGSYDIPIESAWDDEGQVYIVSDVPLPAFVRSVLVVLDTEGE
jgi:hypothetical protein